MLRLLTPASVQPRGWVRENNTEKISMDSLPATFWLESSVVSGFCYHAEGALEQTVTQSVFGTVPPSSHPAPTPGPGLTRPVVPGGGGGMRGRARTGHPSHPSRPFSAPKAILCHSTPANSYQLLPTPTNSGQSPRGRVRGGRLKAGRKLGESRAKAG